MVKFEAVTSKYGVVTAAVQGVDVTPEICAFLKLVIDGNPTPEVTKLVNDAACFVNIVPDAVAGARIELELWGRNPQPLLNFINHQLTLKAHLATDADQHYAA